MADKLSPEVHKSVVQELREARSHVERVTAALGVDNGSAEQEETEVTPVPLRKIGWELEQFELLSEHVGVVKQLRELVAEGYWKLAAAQKLQKEAEIGLDRLVDGFDAGKKVLDNMKYVDTYLGFIEIEELGEAVAFTDQLELSIMEVQSAYAKRLEAAWPKVGEETD